MISARTKAVCRMARSGGRGAFGVAALVAAACLGPALANEPGHGMEGAHKHPEANLEQEMAPMGSGRIPTPEGVSIAIVKPEGAAHVDPGAPLTVSVATEGFDVSIDHWHLYVDDELQAMVGGGRTEYSLDTSGIPEGAHELSVTISNVRHEEYDMEDVMTIIIGGNGSAPEGARTADQ